MQDDANELLDGDTLSQTGIRGGPFLSGAAGEKNRFVPISVKGLGIFTDYTAYQGGTFSIPVKKGTFSFA